MIIEMTDSRVLPNNWSPSSPPRRKLAQTSVLHLHVGALASIGVRF
jgi:hypothetical protein